jgi:hypothetical protein
MLVKRGDIMMLYHSEDKSIPPISFYSMEDYVQYLENQKKQPRLTTSAADEEEEEPCPILFLQQESNAQGEDVYRIRPTLDTTMNGLPQTVMNTPPHPEASTTQGSESPPPYIYPRWNDTDASGGSSGLAALGPDGYGAYDPHGQYIGRYTEMDSIHDMGKTMSLSANPMDPNWGGIEYTKAQIAAGVYDGNAVFRPVFMKAPNMMG